MGGGRCKGAVWQPRGTRRETIQHSPLILFHPRNFGECEKAATQHSWRGVSSLQGLSNGIPSEGAIRRRLMRVARKRERLPPAWPRDGSAQALSRGLQCAVELRVGQSCTPASRALSLPLRSRSPLAPQHAASRVPGDHGRPSPGLTASTRSPAGREL